MTSPTLPAFGPRYILERPRVLLAQSTGNPRLLLIDNVDTNLEEIHPCHSID